MPFSGQSVSLGNRGQACIIVLFSRSILSNPNRGQACVIALLPYCDASPAIGLSPLPGEPPGAIGRRIEDSPHSPCRHPSTDSG